jgi:hypothetical protein
MCMNSANEIDSYVVVITYLLHSCVTLACFICIQFFCNRQQLNMYVIRSSQATRN